LKGKNNQVERLIFCLLTGIKTAMGLPESTNIPPGAPFLKHQGFVLENHLLRITALQVVFIWLYKSFPACKAAGYIVIVTPTYGRFLA
jgi:hypothetical protein